MPEREFRKLDGDLRSVCTQYDFTAREDWLPMVGLPIRRSRRRRRRGGPLAALFPPRRVYLREFF